MRPLRTTVNLHDDVLEAARSIAAAEGRSLGEVLSDLIRRGLSSGQASFQVEDGFPVFTVPPDSAAITPGMVKTALDEP